MDAQRRDYQRYDPRCERMDTALRATLLLTVGKWSNWAQAERLGLSRDEHRGQLVVALDELRAAGVVEDLRRESELFALVRVCPFLVDAAQLLLGLYQASTFESREVYFRRAEPVPAGMPGTPGGAE